MKSRDYSVWSICLLGILSALGGCATCDRHPLVCTVATAVVVGSIAASVQHHHDQGQARSLRLSHGPQLRPPGASDTQPVDCASMPSLCQ